MSKTPAVFFDRDGVLNVDHGYVHKPDEFQWIDGAREGIAALKSLGYLVFVFTNQSGVARGYYEEQDVRALHEWMQQQLAKIGGHIDAFAYCPHHPKSGRAPYLQECGCRKPAPGMLERLLAEWPVDRDRSFVVGDKDSDLQAGAAVGLPGILFQGGRLDDAIRAQLARMGVVLPPLPPSPPPP